MSTQRAERARAWCYTLNNYQPSEVEKLKAIDCKYHVFGYEVGESCGTPHLQGFIQYRQARTMTAVKRDMPRAHLERARGTPVEATNYCKKDGDFWESGDPPKEARDVAKDRWREVNRRAKEGDWDWLEENEPYLWLTMEARLRAKYRANATITQDELPHEWIYGKTGTGKSSSVWERYPNHYQKEKNKWWDLYDGQDVVVIEEWDPSYDMLADKLKIWADRYPFSPEVKGGKLPMIRPKKIIVTSNYSLEECFASKPKCLEALRRRFKSIRMGSAPPAISPDFALPDLGFVN